MTTLKRLLLLGASGAVGRQVLLQALANPDIAQVVAPTRRALAAHAKLENPLPEFNEIASDAPWLKADALICALGTTIKVAGSQRAFAAVDRDLPVRIAGLARQAGATRIALVSSLGASPRGNFYLRTKAETESAIRALGFPLYTIVRPSLIDAQRSAPRRGERLALWVATRLRLLIPRRYRPVKAQRIAAALLAGVLREGMDGQTDGQSGEQIIESEQLQDA